MQNMEKLASKIHAHIMNWIQKNDPQKINNTPLEIAMRDFKGEEDSLFLIELKDGSKVCATVIQVAAPVLYKKIYSADEELTVYAIYKMLLSGIDFLASFLMSLKKK